MKRKTLAFILAGMMAACAVFVPPVPAVLAAESFTWGEWTYTNGQFLRRAVPPVPVPGVSPWVTPDGQWFTLATGAGARPEPIAVPPNGASLGLPGKPFFWGPWMIASGRRLRVLFPFPEFQQGGFLVDPSGKWFAWDDAKKRLRFVKPLEGYVGVKPGK